jgi:hypothetical protein
MVTIGYRNHWVLGIIDDPGAAITEQDDRKP